MKNTIKDTKAMLANAEYYVKTMERTLARGSKYVRCQHMTHCWSRWVHAAYSSQFHAHLTMRLRT